ncbi:unannotated protein [freshwater metagenome]|uniref:Unannotated protein n=1 Tax=freshwater metagenome TaxID=449393 RepID=A0A6J7EHU6_9ZZZZ
MLVLEITQELSPIELAKRFGVSRTTVDRVLEGFLARRPATQGKRSGDLSAGIFTRYEKLKERVRIETGLLDHRARGHMSEAAVIAVFRLDHQIAQASRDLDLLVSGPDHSPTGLDDLEERKHNDVLKTMRRALAVFEAPDGADEPLVDAIIALGYQRSFPRSPSRVERNIRLTLLLGATRLTQHEVGDGFGLTERQVRRVEKTTLLKHPQVAEWAAAVKQQIAEWDNELEVLDNAYPHSKQPLSNIERSRLILVRKQVTLARLGALPSAQHQDHKDRCSDLILTITKLCKKNKLSDECRDRLDLIATAWTQNKRLPAGVPPRVRSTQG